MPITQPPHQDQQVMEILEWPVIEQTAVDEFNTPGYIVQAFPVLFPTGEADLHGNRDRNVTASDYFR